MVEIPSAKCVGDEAAKSLRSHRRRRRVWDLAWAGRVWEVAWADRVWEVGVFSFNLSKGVAAENFGLAPRFPNSTGDFEAGA